MREEAWSQSEVHSNILARKEIAEWRNGQRRRRRRLPAQSTIPFPLLIVPTLVDDGNSPHWHLPPASSRVLVFAVVCP